MSSQPPFIPGALYAMLAAPQAGRSCQTRWGFILPSLLGVDSRAPAVVMTTFAVDQSLVGVIVSTSPPVEDAYVADLLTQDDRFLGWIPKMQTDPDDPSTAAYFLLVFADAAPGASTPFVLDPPVSDPPNEAEPDARTVFDATHVQVVPAVDAAISAATGWMAWLLPGGLPNAVDPDASANSVIFTTRDTLATRLAGTDAIPLDWTFALSWPPVPTSTVSDFCARVCGG